MMITACGGSSFVLDNGLVRRCINVDRQGLYTSSVVNSVSGSEYVSRLSSDFAFKANGVFLSSFTASAVREVDGVLEDVKNPFEFSGSEIKTLEDGSETLTLSLQTAAGVCVSVTYHIYPGIAGFRKGLVIKNGSDKSMKISDVIYDGLLFLPGVASDCEFYFDFDRPAQPVFSADAYEDVIRCYNPELNEGWFLGSNAPGVMRNFLVFPHWSSILCSCNRGGANLILNLEPGEEYKTPESLWCCYKGALEDPATVDGFRNLIRAGLPELKVKEGVMYCTWIPFLRNISGTLVDELSSHAADLGFEYFVIDDGWFKQKSDWAVDEEKFPEGMAAVSEKIRAKGLKFGLWFNIGTDYGAASTKREYVQKLADGSDKNIDNEGQRKVLCFGSEHRHDMVEVLSEIARKYQVSYFKLDFSSVSSPYSTLPWGCHSTEHKYHKGFGDSIPAMYEGLMYLREALRKEFPDLLIDYSFETFGTQMPNIAALEYSDLHHVSNYNANLETSQKISNIRRAFYSWLKVLPPERILNGLLSLKGGRAPEYLLSSLAGAPLVAGDLRTIDAAESERVRKFVAAFKSVVDSGPLTAFETVCNTRERDGFIRKNADGKGIVCLFNRTDQVWSLDIPACRNVETGSDRVEVAPHDCAMYLLG